MKIEFAPPRLYQPAREIIRTLRQSGHEAFIAGGAVRDYLLGRVQTDLDIATSATPEQVRALFPRTFAVGESFGVVIVRHCGRDFEVATFREEDGYMDGRHPGQVRFSTALVDVRRRDFTVNGMLWDPETDELMDWVGGQADVAARLIRTIGPPEERFAEDRLRMLRAVRFAAQLGFGVDSATLQAIRDHAGHLVVVSLERVRQELDKLLAAPAAGVGLDLLEDAALWPVLCRWLREEAGKWDQRRAPWLGSGASGHWRQAWKTASRTIAVPGRCDMQRGGLACLLLDVAGHEFAELTPGRMREAAHALACLMRSLRGSRRDVAMMEELARVLCQLSTFPSLRLADQLRILRGPESDWLREVACHVPQAAPVAWSQMAQLVAYHQSRWHPSPLLTGTELMEMGSPPGPALGAMVKELEALQLEDRLTDKEAACRWARQTLARST
jgi:poly(A) polymerase